MKNVTKILTKNDFKTTTWSGGTTTELFIYPQEAVYPNDDFIFRISSAKVETEESTFTSLPNYNRILMILDGKIKLQHENKYKILLNTFDQDRFDGAFNTTSVGMVTDFNLMMRKEKCTGTVKNVVINSNASEIITLNDDTSCEKKAYFLYCLNAPLCIKLEDDEHLLNKEDALLIENAIHIPNIKITNTSNIKAHLILTTVYF